MTREDITLRGADAEWFRDLKEDVTERRDGHEPTNSEVARLMMEQFEPAADRGGLRR